MQVMKYNISFNVNTNNKNSCDVSYRKTDFGKRRVDKSNTELTNSKIPKQ